MLPADTTKKKKTASPAAAATVPEATVPEIRKKLTPTQLQTILEVAQMTQQAEAHLREQQQKGQLTQRLIFEYHQIPEGTRVVVNTELGELLYTLPLLPAPAD